MKKTGGCHCGATRFELARGPERVTCCTCTNCSKRGALWAYYKPTEVRITSEFAEGIYRWDGGSIGFHFCLHCGCSTYFESPGWTEEGEHDTDDPRVAINARLIDDFDPDNTPVDVVDGRNFW
jgi:hypothetical protein